MKFFIDTAIPESGIRRKEDGGLKREERPAFPYGG